MHSQSPSIQDPAGEGAQPQHKNMIFIQFNVLLIDRSQKIVVQLGCDYFQPMMPTIPLKLIDTKLLNAVYNSTRIYKFTFI